MNFKGSHTTARVHLGKPVCISVLGRVTRSGVLLDFGHLFKAFGNN